MKMQKSVIFVKENLKINIWKIKNLAKLEIIAIIQESTCLGKNTGKYITFTVPIKKEVTRIDENGEEITKIYLTYYSLLIAEDSWQAHYQILLIICLKDFIELNVN